MNGIMRVQQEHRGPLPDPQAFNSYNVTVPGSAERILIMAEQSAQHAREMDKEILHAQLTVEIQNHSEAKAGQMFAIVSVLSMSGVAIYALKLGYPVVAGIICSTTIVGLVAAFITGRLKSSSGSDNSASP